MSGLGTNWLEYVREHLPPLGVGPERVVQIEEELAHQLEDFYWALRRRGLSPEEAAQKTREQITDWDSLARDLRLAIRAARHVFVREF